MNNKKKRLFKRKLILFVSFLFMLFSVYTQTKNMFEQEEYNVNYENININNMSPATVQFKGETDNILETIFMKLKNNFSLKEISCPGSTIIPLKDCKALLTLFFRSLLDRE
jgi:hypothetical protein